MTAEPGFEFGEVIDEVVRYPSHCLVRGVRPRRLPGTSADVHEAYEAERCGTEFTRASISSEVID
jgi:hypothetical protein